MPLLFVYLCDLFDTLEYPHLREVPFLPAHYERYVRDKTVEWLKRHARRINASDTDVMLMLHPEDQTERIYGLESLDLELIIARALRLSRDQYTDLQKWQTAPSSEGLSFHVKRVMDNLKRCVSVESRLFESQSYIIAIPVVLMTGPFSTISLRITLLCYLRVVNNMFVYLRSVETTSPCRNQFCDC